MTATESARANIGLRSLLQTVRKNDDSFVESFANWRMRGTFAIFHYVEVRGHVIR
jgi:hypothetical protein